MDIDMYFIYFIYLDGGTCLLAISRLLPHLSGRKEERLKDFVVVVIVVVISVLVVHIRISPEPYSSLYPYPDR